MEAKQVRIGMVGYKFMGKAHSHAYHDVSMFFPSELVPVKQAICGRNEAAVRQAAQTFGWNSYETSWEKLVARDDIDLVDICSSNDSHMDIAVAAALNGKHVFCEKPLATTVADAQAMLQAVQDAGVKHCVAFNYRKVPAVRMAKQLLEEGRLGTIRHFRAVYLQDWLVDPSAPMAWRLRRASAGSGTLGDIGSHIIDMARYLIGEFQAVVGDRETFVKKRPYPVSGKLQEVDVDDAVTWLARLENGVLGTFEATRYAPGRKNGLRFEINGSQGTIAFDMERMNELEFFAKEEDDWREGFKRTLVVMPSAPYMESWAPYSAVVGVSYEHTFIHLVHELLSSLAKGEMPSPNFVDGLRCQQVMAAVEQSIESKQWVTLEH